MWIVIFQRLTIEFVKDVALFPIWWYTKGMLRTFRFARNLIRTGNEHFVPGLWLKNMFVPMFGQYDLQGRLMSFFIRTMNVLFRTIALCIWIVWVCVLVSIWICLPVFVLFMIVRSLV